MRLASSDGARVELRPVRYQFPGESSSGSGRDWDANWLVVHGDVRLADGRHWSFEDPCLATWEAQELLGWLRGVVSGAVQPRLIDGTDEHIEWFVEPNIALSLAARSDIEATVRVHLSLETRPPWLRLPGGEPGELWEFFVEVSAPLADFAEAAGEWERDLTAFPAR